MTMTTTVQQRCATTRKATVGAGLLVLVVVPVAGQAVPINETRALGPDAFVGLSVGSHSLVVEAWDQDRIQVVGEYDSRFQSLDIESSAQSFRFEIEPVRRFRIADDLDRREGSAELHVRLPRGVRLTANAVSGSVRIGGLSGIVTGRAVSGTVQIEGDLQSVSLNSVSGSVEYRGNAPSVQLQSTSGHVDFEGHAESVELHSISGTARMQGQGETISATSVSGPVELSSSVPVQWLEAESVSGSVSYSGGLAEGGTIQVESRSGSVVLVLSPDAEASFDLSTVSGEITADVPTLQTEVRSRSPFTTQKSLRFVKGSGSGRVEASSVSGSIHVRAPEGW